MFEYCSIENLANLRIWIGRQIKPIKNINVKQTIRLQLMHCQKERHKQKEIDRKPPNRKEKFADCRRAWVSVKLASFAVAD